MTRTLYNDFKAQVPFSCSSIVIGCWNLKRALVALAFIISFGVEVAKDNDLTNLAAVSDFTLGKDEKTTLEIAVRNFSVSLFMNPGRYPLIAAITAEKPDTEMNMCEEGASVAATGNHAQAEISSSIPPTQSSPRPPLLANLTIYDFKNSNCFAVVNAYTWSRVISISEQDVFVVFILEPSYTGRVRSVLTFLEQNITHHIERIREANLKIGFISDYFENQNIKYGSSNYKYEEQFRSINGAAVVIELRDAKVFLIQQCKQFSEWIFLKPILSLWSIYFIYGAISTVCLLLFLIDLIRSHCCEQDETEDNLPSS